MLKSRAESKEQNSYWMGNIRSYYVNGTNMTLAENYEDIVENMNAKDIKNTEATNFLQKWNPIQAVNYNIRVTNYKLGI